MRRMSVMSVGSPSMSSRWISTSFSLPLAFFATSACVALTSELFPMPLAPHNRALLAGKPEAKRSVFSMRMSRTRSIPLSSSSATELTFLTGCSVSSGRMPDEGVAALEVARRRPRRSQAFERQGDAFGEVEQRFLIFPGHPHA